MGLKVIKAIKVKEEQDIDNYREFDNADIILFDTPGMEKSLEFPKNLITKIPIGTKYALAGSISENNIENIGKLGVNFFDLSSSLENQLGYKDHYKIKSFIKKINEIKIIMIAGTVIQSAKIRAEEVVTLSLGTKNLKYPN